MACKVITQFRAKPGHAEDLLGLLKKYVPESARHAGCLEICIQQNQDDPNDIISNQYWQTRKLYSEYFAWRGDQGVDVELQSQCSEPTSVRFFNEVIVAKAPSGN
ncbi:MAG TPA: antibiotic biosynthesis monooxygenase family protein [Nitrospiraceae bacterium]